MGQDNVGRCHAIGRSYRLSRSCNETVIEASDRLASPLAESRHGTCSGSSCVLERRHRKCSKRSVS
jgi:hypothetical protein